MNQVWSSKIAIHALGPHFLCLFCYIGSVNHYSNIFYRPVLDSEVYELAVLK